MASNWSKPYDLTFPLTAQKVEQIDAMFRKLFSTLPLKATRGGTGLSGDDLEIGGLLYGDEESDGDPTFSILSAVTSGSYLRSAGVLTAPVWSTVKIPNTAVTGDLWYASATNTVIALPIGSAGQVVRSTGTLPAYSTFTIPDTFVAGDVLYASAANVLTALAKNASATRYLSNTGASNIPAWAQVSLTQGVTGVLPVLNGGTGISAPTGGSLIYYSSGTAFTEIAIAGGVDNSYLRNAGASTPVWSTLALTNAGVQGDIFVCAAANVMSRLAKNTSATRYVANTGASNQPAWAQVDLTTGVTGVLPVANGGTAAGAFTLGSVVFAGTSGVYTQDNTHFFWDDTQDTLVIGNPGVGLAFNGLQLRGANQFLIMDQCSADAVGCVIVGRKARGGSIGGETATLSGDGLIGMVARGHTGSAYTGNSGTFEVVAAENFTASATGSMMRLQACPIGSTTMGVVFVADGGKNCIVGANPTSRPGAGTCGLLFEDGTALSSLASNTAGIYANDVGGTVCMFGINEAGTTGQLLDAANTVAGIVGKTFTNLVTTAGTNALPSLTLTAGTNLTNAIAGGVENDGINAYITTNTTDGRAAVPLRQHFRLTSNGGNVTTIGNFFGATSNISLVASAYYDIEIVVYFTKTTSEALTWTLTNSASPTSQNIRYEMSPITGVVAPPGTATLLVGHLINDATAARTIVTGSLTTAVNHYAKFNIQLKNGTGTSLKIQATNPAGSITPLLGSYWTATRIATGNTGTFAA